VTVDVVLVAGDTGDRNALALDGLLDKVLTLDLAFTAPVDTSYALVLPARRCPRSGCRSSLDL
jgi:hypothetical protein